MQLDVDSGTSHSGATPTAAATMVVPWQFPVTGAALRIVAIADTHERHWELTGRNDANADYLPPGDVLVHCGDIFRGSRKLDDAEFLARARDFNRWLGTVAGRYKHGIIVVPGNHDVGLERMGADAAAAVLSNCRYLAHRGCTIAGVSFFGSPVSYGCSANKGFQQWERGEAHPRNLLPSYTDVLITHGSYVNGCHNGGGSILHNFVFPRRRDGFGIRCRLHIAGHDHDNYGAAVFPISQVTVSADELAAHPEVWKRLAPPSCPLPQIRRIGRIDEPHDRPSDAQRALRHRYPELCNGAPSQPEILQLLRGGDVKTDRARSSTAAVTCQTVSVVASTLNLRYRLAYRPVEIDIHAIERGATAAAEPPRPPKSEDGAAATATATPIAAEGGTVLPARGAPAVAADARRKHE
mmetsp:Transcript_36739/g.113285  ORF Transcript_36739/g.113285 Transcript_36739/m.113285 type:complete len:410 (-) Transcript_36739:133-1362(-)|eukprot:CAMPEP_0174853352 /NCGR_PEP_ID=MMETSP1114-20130205/28070_1 /TAXON_ID=312471 /ORGANISM="Neobodo designis, Strain CCAP 1951/1" /LENGTH=409 /DNA_ID=CAMNT_0016087989 /DNA_START=81 /DNA_END=1310 /DNA_ORIENTATION=+